jgi:hypothetical protein
LLAEATRTVIDLTALLIAQGQSESARALLQSVFEQFADGFHPVDLNAAEHLLATLR